MFIHLDPAGERVEATSPRTEDSCADQSGNASNHVYDAAAGEVYDTHTCGDGGGGSRKKVVSRVLLANDRGGGTHGMVKCAARS